MKDDFYITTLGCKVNQYESDAISESLIQKGYQKTDYHQAQFIVINSCTVTQKASMQSRQLVRHLIRSNPNAIIIVTGCDVQLGIEDIKQINGIDGIISNRFKHDIPKLIETEFKSGKPFQNKPIIHWADILHDTDFHYMPVTQYGNKTRPVVKIQDGCSSFCKYCIVPYTRGPSRSLPVHDVLNQLTLLESNYYEIVLSGIHLGNYGSDLMPKTTLVDLLTLIEQTFQFKRIRLSSIEPLEISKNLIHVIKNSHSLCHHLHIPLQSGDNCILKSMSRHYTCEEFEQCIHMVVKEIPDIAIGIDIVVGLPGETEDAFMNTYNLIQRLPIAYLHVFPYSPRPQTPAGLLSNQVPIEMIKKRCQSIRMLGEQKRKAFYRSMIGQQMEIIVEGKRDFKTGLLKGYTSNYIPVYIQGDDALMHQPRKVKLFDITHKNFVLGQ